VNFFDEINNDTIKMFCNFKFFSINTVCYISIEHYAENSCLIKNEYQESCIKTH